MRIGIYGRVENSNFGGALTYYALFKYLKSIGEDVKIIPMAFDQKCEAKHRCYNPNSSGAKFAAKYEELAERRNYSDFNKYNDDFDVFVLGSDVCLNDNTSMQFKDTFYFNFVEDRKKIISISPSCQNKYMFDAMTDERINIAKTFLTKFNSISVRDNFTKDYLKNIGIKSQVLFDPVFLLNKEDYIKLATDNFRENFDFYYFATTPKFGYINSETKNRLVLTARYKDDNVDFERKYSSFSVDYTPENWLAGIINCNKFITTSFHGICFALILHKPFYAILTPSSYKQYELINLFNLNGCDHLNMTEDDFRKTDEIILNGRKKLIDFIKQNING